MARLLMRRQLCGAGAPVKGGRRASAEQATEQRRRANKAKAMMTMLQKWLVMGLCIALAWGLPQQAGAQTLKKGDSGWKVKVVQQKLRVLGYWKETPNGKLTVTTADALKKFQKQNGLRASGDLDEKTYKKITWQAFNKEGINKVKGNEIVKTAAAYKGVPYKFGGVTPKGFDCSGYVQYVFKKYNAVLPRTADVQALEGIFVTQKQLKPGDLVFFTTYEAGASHVGIYAGSGKFWNASSSKGVILASLSDAYWKARYYGARRVLVSNGEP